jgi:hypothetical protein
MPRPRSDDDLPLYRPSKPLFYGLGGCVYQPPQFFYGFSEFERSILVIFLV